MRNLQKIPVLLLLMLPACREKYVPEIDYPVVTGFLVVDGYINSGPGPTVITLSRTTKIATASTIVREPKALVRVEAVGNTSAFILTETSMGVYTHPQLTLIPGQQYRLYIKARDGKEFVSDYSDYRVTPDIDSISWRREKDGVQIYANTHAAQPTTGFYQFKYDETWEFVSRYETRLKLIRNRNGQAIKVGFRDSSTYSSDLSLYRCWKSDTSSNIQVYSTEKLEQNVVSLYPVFFIEPNDWRLDQRYSINLKMYAISKNGFQFLEQLKKNTELLGTIFDPQPSDNNGNMHCLTIPSEPVIGFVEISQEKVKRLFISNAEVPGWAYKNVCADEIVVANDSLSFTALKDQIPTNVYEFFTSGGIMSVLFADPICVDCNLRGTNKKPPFW